MICFLDSGVLETKTLTAPAEVQTRKNMINYQPQLVIFFWETWSIKKDFFVHRFPGGTESRPQWKGHSWGHNCWRIGAPESMKTLRDSEKKHYHDDSMNRERCMDNIRTNSKTPGPSLFYHILRKLSVKFSFKCKVCCLKSEAFFQHATFGALSRWSRKVPSHLRCMA